ncbi:MAG: efflux RND transporter periplasmic adaptor subunit [Gemmatimonadaceae bacterium]
MSALVRLRRNWLLPIAGLAVGVATMRLVVTQKTSAQEPATDAAVPVLVRKPGHMVRSNYVALSGEVEGLRTASIGFSVPGVVASVEVNEGDFVRQGQVIATLDRTEYDINVEMAAAQRERAEDEYKRAKVVFEAKGIPENDFNKAGTGVRLARAQEAMARKKLQDTRLVARMSGMLARRGIEPGEQAAPGYPLFTIAQIEPVQVRVGVPESEVSRIAIGGKATVLIPSLKGASFAGRVRLVGIAADPASRTYTAKVELPNMGRKLRPGMIAEVRIEGSESIDALTIPAEAVVRDAAGILRVYVYEAKTQRVYARRVTIGAAYGQEVEVRDGVVAADMVVVGGQHRVREGSRVVARVVVAPTPMTKGER